MHRSALSSTGALRIVVTDDDPMVLAAIVIGLREAGHCVFAAYDGEAARELATLIPGIDLLITNTRIGGHKAPWLIRQVRLQKPAMPILHIATGDTIDEPLPPDVHTVRAPFTPDVLLDQIHALLARRAGIGGIAGSIAPSNAPAARVDNSSIRP
ncbi:MAG: hypothetical protein H0W67_05130 [Gemmatimonadales bacterium]|nr:hypothetical protein [Gemmatimonadales bacterium]